MHVYTVVNLTAVNGPYSQRNVYTGLQQTILILRNKMLLYNVEVMPPCGLNLHLWYFCHGNNWLNFSHVICYVYQINNKHDYR